MSLDDLGRELDRDWKIFLRAEAIKDNRVGAL